MTNEELNTELYHNHFVINSVSYKDGHHFHNSPADYKAMRRESDRLCREYGLSVVDFPQGKGRNYAEYKAEMEHKPTLRSMIRKDIDNAIKGSMTTDNFYENLESLGYELKLYTKDGKWLSYLEETEGYFQCDYCNKVVLSQEYWPSEDVDDKFSYIPLMKSLAG